MRIDMHSHYYGGGLVETLRGRKTHPRLRTRADGVTVMSAMNGEFPFTDAYHDPQVCLAEMRKQGLTHRLLTFPGALGADLLPATEIAPVISAFNDHLAQLGIDSDGSLIGLAGVPLDDLDIACAELRRVRRDLGLPGIILPSNYFNSLAEADSLRPLFEAANEYGCHIMLHPGLKVGQNPAAAPRGPDAIPTVRSGIAIQRFSGCFDHDHVRPVGFLPGCFLSDSQFGRHAPLYF